YGKLDGDLMFHGRGATSAPFTDRGVLSESYQTPRQAHRPARLGHGRRVRARPLALFPAGHYSALTQEFIFAAQLSARTLHASGDGNKARKALALHARVAASHRLTTA